MSEQESRSHEAWPRLYTIGHSNHGFETFARLLDGQAIDTVADVRSAPWSRYAPWFNANSLAAELKAVGVDYVPMGEQLGGRPADPRYYLAERPADGRRVSPVRIDGQYVDYERLSRSETFEAGVARLVRGCERHSIALLCSEEDPRRCHRHLLVAHALVDQGVEVLHLRASGGLEAATALIEEERQQQPEASQPNLF